jgi:hypothetical protein
LVKQDVLLIGASADLAVEFLSHLDNDKFRTYLISSNKSVSFENDNVLKINDYVNDVNLITEFINKTTNPIIIFFNGYISENRPKKFPNTQEIIKTDYVNFVVPYVLTVEINNSIEDIKNFVYISSFSASRARYKNYLYGITKRKLEKSIKLLNPSSYLFIRYGKIDTKFSQEHMKLPFSMSKKDAAKILLDSINKTGVIYPNFLIGSIALIVKLLPSKFLKRLNV